MTANGTKRAMTPALEAPDTASPARKAHPVTAARLDAMTALAWDALVELRACGHPQFEQLARRFRDHTISSDSPDQEIDP